MPAAPSPARPRRPWATTLLVVLIVSLPAGPIPAGRADEEPRPGTPTAPPTPAPPAFAFRGAIHQEVRRRFQAEDWIGLDALAKRFRESRGRMANGHWQLPFFYGGLDPDGRAKDAADWERALAKLDAWKTAVPGSPTQPVVRAEILTSYAWEARGDGWSHEVTPEGWRRFHERLAQARAVLEAAPPDDVAPGGRCPHWAAVMQKVALGQGWKRADYERLFADAVGREPTYHEYYFRKAYFLLPRWHGRPGEWERFALEAAGRLNPDEGMAIYARIVWEMEDFYDDLFQESEVTWARMREGFHALLQQFPDSRWNRNHFARFAFRAGDRETTREILDSLGEVRLDPEAWDGPGLPAVARAFADPATPAHHLTPAARLRRSDGVHKSKVAVHALAFAPDGRSLAGGYADGSILVWELAAGRVVWQGRVSEHDDPVVSVGFSPDGKLLAAGTAELIETNHPGTARVWETADARREVDHVTAFKGGVYRLVWAPDGRTLALTGGTYHRAAEGFFWDRETRAVRPMGWPDSHRHQLHAAAFSPDGKVFATDCNRSLTVWDVGENRSRFDTRQSLPTGTMAVAFSPDGKTLAAAGAPGWDDRVKQPGTVIVFDTEKWLEQAAPRVSKDVSGLLTLAYSPDGRWLAAGGLDGGVHVWEAATLRRKALYVGHKGDTVRGVAFSPDGKTLASAGEDGAILLWEAPAE